MREKQSNNIEESITCSRKRRTDGFSYPADDRNAGQQLDNRLHRTRRTVRSWSPGGSRLEPTHDYSRNDNERIIRSSSFFSTFLSVLMSQAQLAFLESSSAQRNEPLRSLIVPELAKCTRRGYNGHVHTVYPTDIYFVRLSISFGFSSISCCSSFHSCSRWP